MSILDQLLKISEEHQTHVHDYIVTPREMVFDDLCNLYLPPATDLFGEVAVEPLAPTDWAYNQLFRKLGPGVMGPNRTLPKDYMMALEPYMRAANLNYALERADTKNNWLIRGYDNTVRAFLSDKYLRVSNLQVLQLAKAGLDQSGLKNVTFVRSWVSPDTLAVKVVLLNRDHPRGRYGVGFFLGNGEIGNHTVKVLPLIQRHSCTNSIIVDTDEAVVVRHHGDWDYLRYRILNAIKHVFDLGCEWLERMIQAEDQEIENFEDVLTGIAKKYGWGDNELVALTAGAEGHRSLAGVAYAVSYAAHQIAEENSELQVELERLAGRILVDPSRVFAKRASVEEEVVEE